jgi:hypothetical protein
LRIKEQETRLTLHEHDDDDDDDDDPSVSTIFLHISQKEHDCQGGKILKHRILFLYKICLQIFIF